MYSVSRSNCGQSSVENRATVSSISARASTSRACISRNSCSVGRWVKPPTVIAIGWVCRPATIAHRSPESFLIFNARSTIGRWVFTSGMTEPTPRKSGATR